MYALVVLVCQTAGVPTIALITGVAGAYNPSRYPGTGSMGEPLGTDRYRYHGVGGAKDLLVLEEPSLES
jgi:hypothetical protein